MKNHKFSIKSVIVVHLNLSYGSPWKKTKKITVLITNTWKRKWQPTPGFLPGDSHGQGSLADTT